MQTPPYPEVPPDFGHWLAGFIDGEGCFMITRRQRGGYQIAFSLKVRADERPILERCVAATGIGYLDFHRNGRSRPQLRWLVGTKADCCRLVEILDRFPLRAKKAKDYAIWREAMPLRAAIGPGGRPTGVRQAWKPIGRLRDELIAGRSYDPAAAIEP